MSSHGIARTARTRTEEQRLQQLDKIESYRALEDQARQRIANKLFDQETFELTSKLLRLNPEYYTIWNARRRCLISGLLSRPSAGSLLSRESPSMSAIAISTSSSAASSPSSSTTATRPAPEPPIAGKTGTTASDEPLQKDAKAIRIELAWTIPLLMEFPKCYWIWGYRLWVLERAIERLPQDLASGIWEEELGLVSKMLTRDRRNFHAWGYRRHVVSKLESPALKGISMVEPEFEYTTKMIHQDLSNFSAWHNRSQLILRLLNERKSDNDMRKAFLDKELDLVRDALNVGPEDQSLWYYHQFLILSLVERTDRSAIAPHLTTEQRKSYIDRELDDIKDLLDDYDDIKWIYEALVQYTVTLSQLIEQPLDESRREDVAQWLRKLASLDPMRNGRWNDLRKELRIE